MEQHHLDKIQQFEEMWNAGVGVTRGKLMGTAIFLAENNNYQLYYRPANKFVGDLLPAFEIRKGEYEVVATAKTEAGGMVALASLR